jgi:1,2-phenylacetyl-CoA epoxidase PaaB subunit
LQARDVAPSSDGCEKFKMEFTVLAAGDEQALTNVANDVFGNRSIRR